MWPKKRLVVAERTKFMAMKQEIDERIIKYLHSLRNASRYCEFEKFWQEEQTIEGDLIQLRLIEGMYNTSHWYKIMEWLQIRNMSLNTCLDFIQQQELIQKYNHHKSQPSEQIFADTYMLKKILKMFVLWTGTWNKKGKMPSIWEDLCKLLKKEPFSSSMQIWKKSLERVEENETTMQVFSIKNKNIMLKVKINNSNLDMQMDTGSEVTLIPRNFWECIGKSTFERASYYSTNLMGWS